ncbi:MAG: hypothetical protein RL154_130 [Pseudomonadota bacterium]|jgi:YesN/AraC family two-component response regulator
MHTNIQTSKTIKEYSALLNELGENQSVLVVEDDLAANQLAVNFLSKYYSKVDSAVNGEEGLEKYKSAYYDIVITDICMPLVSGLELCSRIKKLRSDQKIIIISAFSSSEYLKEAMKLGIDEYVFKPFDYECLLKTLYRLSKHIQSRYLNEYYYRMALSDNRRLLSEQKQLLEQIEFLSLEIVHLKNNQVEQVLANDENELVLYSANNLFSSYVSAHEFLENLALQSDNKIAVLDSLLEKLYTLLYKLSIAFDDYILQRCIEYFKECATILLSFQEFIILGSSLHTISSSLEVANNHIDRVEIFTNHKLHTLLGYAIDNLHSWMNNIFIFKTAQDILYMNDSFKSEIEEISRLLLKANIEHDDELELF